jgi:glutaconyl-CoA decarboxylase
VESEVASEVERVRQAGLPADKIHQRGQMTVWDRLEYLVDEGTCVRCTHPLQPHKDNEEGTTGVIDGLGKISGRWAVVVGFDNKVMAGAWIPGQAENILRVTDMAKAAERAAVLAGELQRGEADHAGGGLSGPERERDAVLSPCRAGKAGVPVLAGIYGTNPAGGGYQGISPTLLIAHQDANIAVAGRGDRGRDEPQGVVRPGRGHAVDRGHAAHQGGAAGEREDSPRPDRIFP